MQCVGCEGAGCDACHGRGRVKIEGCPADLVTPDIWQLASEAADAEAGFLPEGGGMNDQTQAWVTGLRRYRTERADWKRRLKANDSNG